MSTHEYENGKAFNNALSNFTFSLANGDLIKRLADKGYSVAMIKKMCDYPVSEKKVQETVWNHYIETGYILLSAPDKEHHSRTDFVMDIGKYGKRSFRAVEAKSANINKNNYIPCDFGVIKANSPDEYIHRLSKLDSRMRNYVDGLPWPDYVVYHKDMLMIREIITLWNT